MTRQVLAFERLTPEPGPDADSVRHELVAHVTSAEGDVLEAGGIATVWELSVDGAVVAHERSAFARTVVRLAPGEHEVRIVVHPLADLLAELPTRPRQRWRTSALRRRGGVGRDADAPRSDAHRKGFPRRTPMPAV